MVDSPINNKPSVGALVFGAYKYAIRRWAEKISTPKIAMEVGYGSYMKQNGVYILSVP